ncbi:uncharacterized protein [Amphiura filiformis]|uniref:uncharacterized protein n=1 Tax=Amphiura filiformis TaxID=82378 RepID=UPI003B2158B4
MLVGQERAGKTSLRKNLTGQGFDPQESITNGIDTMDTCRIDVIHSKAWEVQEQTADHLSLESDYVMGISQQMKHLLTETESDRDETQTSQQAIGGHSSHPGVDFDPGQLLQIPCDIRDDVVQQMKGVDTTTPSLLLSIWDFAGQDIFYTTHQVFLSSRAVYVVVFDLSLDLDKPAPVQNFEERLQDLEETLTKDHEFTCLEFLHYWMHSIYAYTTSNANSDSTARKQLTPPVFVVGTHKNSVPGVSATEKQRQIEIKFKKIRQSLQNKPYKQHIVLTFYAIENDIGQVQDDEISRLRRHVEEVSLSEPYIEERIPLRWLQFEQAISVQIRQEVHYLNLNEVTQLASTYQIDSSQELFVMLQFYHDLGHIVYFGGKDCQNESLKNIIILDPHWLIDVFRRVITVRDEVRWQWSTLSDSFDLLDEEGILEDRLIDLMWEDSLGKKEALLQLMIKYDLLCEQMPSSKSEVGEASVGSHRYYVPSRLKPSKIDHKEMMPGVASCSAFYIDFRGFLPSGLFHRLLTRTARWSQDQGGKEPQLRYRWASFYADDMHELVLEMSSAQTARIKVLVFKAHVVGIYGESHTSAAGVAKPSPEAVQKVREFLEITLADLTNTWMRQVSYRFCIKCPRSSEGTPHFVDLRCCLTEQKNVECESRQCRLRINTKDVKAMFSQLQEEKLDEPKSTSPSPRSPHLIPEDRHLSSLAQKIGQEWHRLAIQLNLTQAEVYKVKEENRHDVWEQIYQMLRMWKRKEGVHATLENLVLACQESEVDYSAYAQLLEL